MVVTEGQKMLWLIYHAFLKQAIATACSKSKHSALALLLITKQAQASSCNTSGCNIEPYLGLGCLLGLHCVKAKSVVCQMIYLTEEICNICMLSVITFTMRNLVFSCFPLPSYFSLMKFCFENIWAICAIPHALLLHNNVIIIKIM